MAAEKKPRKVMDAVHPGDTPASPTSRPIVGNRAYIASDPMLNEQEKDASAEKPSGSESTATKEAAAKEPAVSREAKNIKPISDDPSDKEYVPDTDAEESPKTDTADASEQKEQKDINQTADTPVDVEPKPPEEDGVVAPEAPTVPVSDTQEATEDDTDEPEEVPQQTPEDEAAAAREAELERHIAAGTYAVPIGQVKHRKQKMTLILVLVVLVVAVVALDVLLDMDVFELSGVPHTNFL